MKRQNRDIYGKPLAADNNRASNWFEDALLLNPEDSDLFGNITDYMKGRRDIEDVKNDPALSVTDKAVREMISDYNKNISGNSENESFIKGVLAESAPENEIHDEISKIKQEVKNNHLDKITVEWVKEWHEKRQSKGFNPDTEKIKDFITSSLNSEESEPAGSLNAENNKGQGRTLVVRYFSLSAAAVIGILIIVRTLLPSYDPDKLFKSYYEPFKAVSGVTRSAASDETNAFSAALEQYRHGDYQTATAGFSSVVLKDTSNIASRFFMGIAQMGSGNYDQAVKLLSSVTGRTGEYHKEAVWYLGLAYLKTGEKEKAAGCFSLLAKSPGFYSGRAGKILRRLE